MRVPFCDLQQASEWWGVEVEHALQRVARSGRYVLGTEVEAFEAEWAAVCGAPHAVGVGNGTDALALILRALGIGAGDEVIVPAYTAAATWMAVAWIGARPVGADVDPATGVIDPLAVAAAIGARTRAIIAVHLFGRLAPAGDLRDLAHAHGLALVEDAAHAHGVDEGAGPAGSFGTAAAFSFYPTKILGAIGDAGAVVTADRGLAESVRRLRAYGWSSWQGDSPAIGSNSRLDEAQAAVLRAKLPRLPATLERLSAIGRRYRKALQGAADLELAPAPAGDHEPPWHQFVVTHPARDLLRTELRRRGIGTAVHYDPIPPSLGAFAPSPSFPAAENLARRALSLPCDPWLSDAQADVVCDAMLASLPSSARSRK